VAFLKTERDQLEAMLPGLDEALAKLPLDALESGDSPGLPLFRSAGGPGLVVPAHNTGLGATPLQAVRVQRAIGARSPSLAAATTMHHFSVASLLEQAAHGAGFEWMLLEAIVRDRMLVASGFAEGHTGQSVLRPAVRAERRGKKVVLNGSKKPCSLARSMDLLTVSVMLDGTDGGSRLAVAIVPASADGLSVRPFWGSPILAGAESDEVVLEDVVLDSQMVVLTDVTASSDLDTLHVVGFLWFELLITAGYLGAASALVERVLDRGAGSPADRAAMVTDLNVAMLAVEAVASAMTDRSTAEDSLVDALMVRYAAQDAIARACHSALATLGGMAFIGSGEGSYLASAAAGLMFHPPSRGRMAEQLCAALDGGRLRIN
jgi:alkylation response protein AidB-like acyl-CoA dehydrogenase